MSDDALFRVRMAIERVTAWIFGSDIEVREEKKNSNIDIFAYILIYKEHFAISPKSGSNICIMEQ